MLNFGVWQRKHRARESLPPRPGSPGLHAQPSPAKCLHRLRKTYKPPSFRQKSREKTKQMPPDYCWLINTEASHSQACSHSAQHATWVRAFLLTLSSSTSSLSFTHISESMWLKNRAPIIGMTLLMDLLTWPFSRYLRFVGERGERQYTKRTHWNTTTCRPYQLHVNKSKLDSKQKKSWHFRA